MAKIYSVYPHARLVCCPERWNYYKEIDDMPLVLLESQKKYPRKLFFNFSGLGSSCITKIKSFQYNIKSPLYIKIWTHNNKHLYMFEVWYDN